MSGDLTTGIPTSTTFELPGYTVEQTLGLAWGLIVRSVGLTKGLTGGLRALRPARCPSSPTWSTRPGTRRWNG